MCVQLITILLLHDHILVDNLVHEGEGFNI